MPSHSTILYILGRINGKNNPFFFLMFYPKRVNGKPLQCTKLRDGFRPRWIAINSEWHVPVCLGRFWWSTDASQGRRILKFANGQPLGPSQSPSKKGLNTLTMAELQGKNPVVAKLIGTRPCRKNPHTLWICRCMIAVYKLRDLLWFAYTVAIPKKEQDGHDLKCILEEQDFFHEL